MFEDTFSHDAAHMIKCVFSGLTSLSTIFSHITMVSGCNRELNTHYYILAKKGNAATRFFIFILLLLGNIYKS